MELLDLVQQVRLGLVLEIVSADLGLVELACLFCARAPVVHEQRLDHLDIITDTSPSSPDLPFLYPGDLKTYHNDDTQKEVCVVRTKTLGGRTRYRTSSSARDLHQN